MAVGREELDISASIMADEFGTPGGQYIPTATGVPVTVTPVMTYGSQILDDFGGYELRDLAEIDMSELPDIPSQGDSLFVESDSYTVDTWAPVGSMWHIVLRAYIAPEGPSFASSYSTGFNSTNYIPVP